MNFFLLIILLTILNVFLIIKPVGDLNEFLIKVEASKKEILLKFWNLANLSKIIGNVSFLWFSNLKIDVKWFPDLSGNEKKMVKF